MGFCHKCGNNVNDNHAFCHECGEPVKKPEGRTYEQYENMNYGAYTPTKAPSKKNAVLSLVFAIIALEVGSLCSFMPYFVFFCLPISALFIVLSFVNRSKHLKENVVDNGLTKVSKILVILAIVLTALSALAGLIDTINFINSGLDYYTYTFGGYDDIFGDIGGSITQPNTNSGGGLTGGSQA